MAYLIPINDNHMEWHSARREVLGEIMKTDVLCEVLYTDTESASVSAAMDEAFETFRDFESRYSRFIEGNDLWQLNSQEETRVSQELFNILTEAKRYYGMTGGIFDPSILSALEASGYMGAYSDHVMGRGANFSEIVLDASTRTVKKPASLMIDLGGIGKGFVIDKVIRSLGDRFENVLVDAGGDIAVKGVNEKDGYPYWAVDIEHPKMPDTPVMTLLLKDMAVATSGRNRRRWMYQGKEQHHIIDPVTQESASDELLSVTVIASSATEADVFAKTLFIAGKEKGSVMADELRVPAVFIDKNGIVICNHYVEPYAWKP